MNRSMCALALVALVASAMVAQVTVVPVQPPTLLFPGTVVTPGGGVCTGPFLLDGGNLAQTTLGHGCATNAGLGMSISGVFVPPAGTGCAVVNGNDPMWVFDCITVAANDTNGNACFCKVTVYVAKNASSHLNRNILSRGWGACVGAVDPFYGSGIWPAVVVPGYQVTTVQTTGNHVGGPVREAFHVTLVGNDIGAGTPIANEFAVYSGVSAYTFLPSSVASDLNLPVIETIDMSTFHPDSLLGLDLQALRPGGQTLFDVVAIPGLDLGDGVMRSGYALVLNSVNSNFVVLGGHDDELFPDVAFIPKGAGDHDVLHFGGVAAANPPLGAFGMTPAAVRPHGGLVLEPVLPAEGFVEGMVLLSFDVRAGAFGTGPVFGIFPDAMTSLSWSRPASVGDPLHFLNAAGQFPHVPLTLPAGVFPPSSQADIAMAYLTPAGQIRTTSPTRLSSHP